MQRPRARTWLALAVWGAIPAVAGGTGCRTATQIIVDVESEQCSRIQSTDVTVAGDETALAAKTISDASRTGCVSAPQVGRIVLVPDGDDDKEVVIRIVSGLDKPASTCREGDEGCIIARRRARFVPNEVVRLSVVMSLTCQRVVCTAGESCDPLTGKCVDIAGGSAPSPDAGVADSGAGVDAGPGCTAAGCVLECNWPRHCRGAVCQPGLPCVINCNGPGACEDVDCGAASSCEVNCKTDDACRGRLGIRCRDAGSCTVDCRSRRACGTGVICSCNGECTVKCSSERCDPQNVVCCKDETCHMPDAFQCFGECG